MIVMTCKTGRALCSIQVHKTWRSERDVYMHFETRLARSVAILLGLALNILTDSPVMGRRGRSFHGNFKGWSVGQVPLLHIMATRWECGRQRGFVQAS